MPRSPAARSSDGACRPTSPNASPIAIILHMQPGVTLADGVEALLLDRATGLDVRGVEFEIVEEVRPAVMRDFPRGPFDRHFLDAFRREAAIRPTCQARACSTRRTWPGWMARSPWVTSGN